MYMELSPQGRFGAASRVWAVTVSGNPVTPMYIMTSRIGVRPSLACSSVDVRLPCYDAPMGSIPLSSEFTSHFRAGGSLCAKRQNDPPGGHRILV